MVASATHIQFDQFYLMRLLLLWFFFVFTRCLRQREYGLCIASFIFYFDVECVYHALYPQMCSENEFHSNRTQQKQQSVFVLHLFDIFKVYSPVCIAVFVCFIYEVYLPIVFFVWKNEAKYKRMRASRRVFLFEYFLHKKVIILKWMFSK